MAAVEAPPTAAPILSRPANVSRTSHFSEGLVDSYAAESIYQASSDMHHDSCHLRKWMRVFNALVHITVCILLLMNMAGFLAEFQGTYFKYLT